MTLTIRNQQDFVSGIVFGVVGVAALTVARKYPFGTLAHVGPGFFPLVAATVLTGFGLVLLLRSLAGKQAAPVSLAPLPILVIVGSSLLFAFLLRPLGLPLSAMLLVLLSTLASRSLGWLSALALAVGVAAFVTLVFVVGLGLQMPVLGTWFS
ncbi:tripartite tricarboxylate transporter TctB family protein [Mesorhizobium sp. ANAO-SY3R2]|uniref:tripartite tricarboxylate transporter TctB family protein n=1 Tax=Mesorhizobium sp. ANAO-SY3R2 TaxID=3166644 RepID=UPI003670CBA1